MVFQQNTSFQANLPLAHIEKWMCEEIHEKRKLYTELSFLENNKSHLIVLLEQYVKMSIKNCSSYVILKNKIHIVDCIRNVYPSER